jgi:hypothetical protein
MTTSYHTSIHSEEVPQPPPVPPAPWMPLGPLTELWAAFGREATSPEALLAASRAFAALADERDALHTLNWLAPAWLPSAPRTGAAAEPTSFSLLMTQEAIIEALSRAATHWYEAARVLVEYAEQPHSRAREQDGESPEPDLETLIGDTRSQRVRVWAIARSLLAEQLQQLSPHREQQGGQAQ